MDNRDIIKYFIKVMDLSPTPSMFMYTWVVIKQYVVVVLEEREWAGSFEKEYMRKTNRNWYFTSTDVVSTYYIASTHFL